MRTAAQANKTTDGGKQSATRGKLATNKADALLYTALRIWACKLVYTLHIFQLKIYCMNNVTTTDSIELLNDLLAINNDRIVGYEKALKETKDENADLKPVFTSMIDESRTIRNELAREVQALGGSYESGT
jgi:hypothetical protein